MRKIAHIISAFDVFGPEKTTINECKWLKSKGWDCIIINIWDELDVPIKQKINDAGIDYNCLISTGKFESKTIRSLRKVLIDNEIDIVHSHGYKSDTYTFLATLATPIKIVTTIHGWTSENPKVRLYERLQAFLWRYYNKVYAVSKKYKLTALKKGVPDSKLDLLYNGIITSNSQLSKNEEKSHNSTCVNVGIVGRLSIEKAHEFYLEVAQIVCRERKDILFNIIGDGPQSEKLKRIVDKNSLNDSVKFLGHIDDMSSVYRQMDIMVICSLREGLPNVLLEAMFNKIPVVSVDVGGVPEVIDEKYKGGVIIYNRDINKFTEEIVKLADDFELRKTIGDNGSRHIIENFSFEKRMNTISNDYVDLIDN